MPPAPVALQSLRPAAAPGDGPQRRGALCSPGAPAAEPRGGGRRRPRGRASRTPGAAGCGGGGGGGGSLARPRARPRARRRAVGFGGVGSRRPRLRAPKRRSGRGLQFGDAAAAGVGTGAGARSMVSAGRRAHEWHAPSPGSRNPTSRGVGVTQTRLGSQSAPQVIKTPRSHTWDPALAG